MTTLRDLLQEFQQETRDLCESELSDKEFDLDDYDRLLDEYIERIKERLIG